MVRARKFLAQHVPVVERICGGVDQDFFIGNRCMLVRTQPPRHQAGSRRIGLAGGLKSLNELFPTFCSRRMKSFCSGVDQDFFIQPAGRGFESHHVARRVAQLAEQLASKESDQHVPCIRFTGGERLQVHLLRKAVSGQTLWRTAR